MRAAMRVLASALLLLLVAGLLTERLPGALLSGWEKKRSVETEDRMAAISAMPNTDPDWPPVLGRAFPNGEYFDHRGAPFSFSALRGKPVLIEFIAMTCAGCQAWSGGGRYGAFENFAVQRGLDSIENYFAQYTGGLTLSGGELSFVQLVNYNIRLNSPTPQQLAAWRSHFHLTAPNYFVISGGERLRNSETFRRIPGFALLDRDGVMRFEALGHQPRHDLYRELLPAIRKMIGR